MQLNIVCKLSCFGSHVWLVGLIGWPQKNILCFSENFRLSHVLLSLGWADVPHSYKCSLLRRFYFRVPQADSIINSFLRSLHSHLSLCGSHLGHHLTHVQQLWAKFVMSMYMTSHHPGGLSRALHHQWPVCAAASPSYAAWGGTHGAHTSGCHVYRPAAQCAPQLHPATTHVPSAVGCGSYSWPACPSFDHACMQQHGRGHGHGHVHVLCCSTAAGGSSPSEDDQAATTAAEGTDLSGLLAKERMWRDVASVLYTNRDVAKRVLATRPGVMLMPNVATYMRGRLAQVARKHGVPPRMAAQMIIQNPNEAWNL